MTKNTELTMADVEKLVDGFDVNFKVPAMADIRKNNDAIEGLHEKSADRTYDMIAALVELAEALGADVAVDGGYKEFLNSRNQKVARGGNNPYGPFIKAVYSVLNKDGVWVFDNRSAEKYANVLRHIVPLVRGKKLSGSIQDYIRNYDHSTYGKKMRGIEAQDRADNPNSAAEKRGNDLREKGKKTPIIVSIKQDFGFAAHKAVMLRGRVNANGEVEVLEAKALNDDEANSFYYNLGLAA